MATTAHRSFRLLVCACTIFAASMSIARDDPPRGEKQNDKPKEKPAIDLIATRCPGNVFAEEEADFKFRIETQMAIKGRVVWRLASGTATVKSGEVDFNSNPKTPADVSVKVAVPPLKDGVILHTRLTLGVIEDQKNKAAVTFEQDVWIFPKDAFADRAEWLKKLKLALYDPKGETAKVFTAAKIPFEELRGVEGVLAQKGGMVIVGEGIAWKDEPWLGAALVKLASAGVTVLVLAPANGELVIPGLGGASAGVEEVSLRRTIVRTLDKRLDPEGWMPDGKAVACSVVVKNGEDTVTAEVTPGATGWPWIEARFPNGKGRWTFCGLGVIAKWEAGPTPRFFFARVLEYLTSSESEQPKKENER